MGVTNGKFEDFIGIWDNSLNVGVCKELIKYHNWIIENNYNIRPDIDGSILNHPMQVKDEAIYLSSSSPQYPIALCKTYWDCIYKCVGEYIKNYGIGIQDYLSSFVFKIHKVKESQGYHIWHCENSAYEVRDRFLVFLTHQRIFAIFS